MRGIYLYGAVLIAVILTLFYPKNNDNDPSVTSIARVTAVDNSRVIIQGVARLGDQFVSVKTRAGKEYQIRNLLSGALEYDEFYQTGNWVIVSELGDQAALISIMRMHIILFLGLLLFAGLWFYARKVGIKAILSFIGSIVIIFKILIPGLMAGDSPLVITTLTVFALSCLIILSVAGFTIKGFATLSGTVIGLLVTSCLCIFVGHWMHIDGLNQPLAQPLFFEEHMQLNMLGVLYSAIIIGASGAAMDIAMEMSATMEELQRRDPSITRKQLLHSGIRVGTAVIGTMTTTLLLAYSGGFLTLMMLFTSRENDIMQIMNMKIVTTEVARVLIGSLSLIIVAPITAYIASWLYTRHRQVDLSSEMIAID